jgi:phosphate:Na+ symporter
MTLMDGITFLSGVALLLYGFSTMEQSLEKLLGGTMDRIISSLTSSAVRSVLFGVIFAGLIQSSAATTIFIVGLVNAGIIDLSAAVAVIMGANIGTTVTNQLMRLSELSTSAWANVLDPTFFGSVACFVGAVMYVILKNQPRKRLVGQFCVGFGLVFLGMESIASGAQPLCEAEMFRGLFGSLSNPFLGLLVGAAVAALLQNSAAGVTLLQSMAKSGVVTYSVAVPIVLGLNIGVCALPLLSAMGTTKDAKRAALSNLYFNMIGSVLFLSVFYTVKEMLSIEWWSQPITASGVAMFHTLFNVCATVLMLPFMRWLVYLTKMTISDYDNTLTESGMPTLDVHLLDTPVLALRQASEALSLMATTVDESYADALPVLFTYNAETVDHIRKNHEVLEKMADSLSRYLVLLFDKAVGEENAGAVQRMSTCLVEYDRIMNSAVALADYSGEMMQKDIKFSDDAVRELYLVDDAVMEILDLAHKACNDSDAVIAERVEPLAVTIRQMAKAVRERHTQRQREGRCSFEVGSIFVAVITELENVAEHCSNIAACVQYGGLGTRSMAAAKTVNLNGPQASAEKFNDILQSYRRKYYAMLEVQETPMPQL